MTGEPAWFAGPEHQSFELVADPPRGVALLLHGFPGTPAELRPLGEVLAAAGVSALAPLLPGFGPAWPLGALLPLVQHLVPSIGLLDRGPALDTPELREFFARAAPDLDLDRPEVRAELRQHVRLPTAAIAQLWRLSIGSGAAACRVRVPTLILQGQADRVVRPHDTRVLGERLRGPVQLHELAAGHLLLDPAGSAWDLVRELILSFTQG